MASIPRELLFEALLSEPMMQYIKAKFSELPRPSLLVRIEEFLKFMVLATRIRSGPLPVSKEIDELWHAFILETREYERLCQRIGRFVHHTALVSNDGTIYPNQLETDLLFVVAYVTNFGNFSSETALLWPATHRLMAYLNLDIISLNALAEDLSAQAEPLRVTLDTKPASYREDQAE